MTETAGMAPPPGGSKGTDPETLAALQSASEALQVMTDLKTRNDAGLTYYHGRETQMLGYFGNSAFTSTDTNIATGSHNTGIDAGVSIIQDGGTHDSSITSGSYGVGGFLKKMLFSSSKASPSGSSAGPGTTTATSSSTAGEPSSGAVSFAMNASGGSRAPTEDVYDDYMSGTSKARAVEALSKSQKARDELKRRIAEMLAGSVEEKAKAGELSQILTEAEAQAVPANRDLSDVSPMSSRDAFHLEDDSTREARGILARLVPAQFDEGLTRPESLFERVKSVHDRRAKMGQFGQKPLKLN